MDFDNLFNSPTQISSVLLLDKYLPRVFVRHIPQIVQNRQCALQLATTLVLRGRHETPVRWCSMHQLITERSKCRHNRSTACSLRTILLLFLFMVHISLRLERGLIFYFHHSFMDVPFHT